jgi:carotenoid 1,2-hydratase
MDWARKKIEPSGVPSFHLNVPDQGYAWWYVDVLCPEQSLGMTLIFFLGSVFSPAYAKARRKGHGSPLAHTAVNVALYSKRSSEWVFSEYNLGSKSLEPSSLTVGPNTLRWDGDTLVIQFDEITSPFPRWPRRRLKGEVRLKAASVFHDAYSLHPSHLWRPIAPVAHAEVVLTEPDLSFQGSAYHDFNAGNAPLERDFLGWSWARKSARGETSVLYDVQPVEGPSVPFGQRFFEDGRVESIDPTDIQTFPRTYWGLDRSIRKDPDATTRVVRTLEDGPFYSRTWLQEEQGERVDPMMHESIRLDRFSRRFVQFLLNFRVRRT